MQIGPRVKQLREQKKLSQGDIEKRTGLLRCYLSRVENSHTVPSVDTLEKLARALEAPLYRLFTDSDSVTAPSFPQNGAREHAFGVKSKEHRELILFAKALARMNPRDQKMLMRVAARMAKRA